MRQLEAAQAFPFPAPASGFTNREGVHSLILHSVICLGLQPPRNAQRGVQGWASHEHNTGGCGRLGGGSS